MGICAGQQILGRRIIDHIESGAGEVAGLGLVDVDTCFVPDKVVRRIDGHAGVHPVAGYQIHHGRSTAAGDGWLALDGQPEGAIGSGGRVRTTSLHGLFDADEFRRALLTEVAERQGREYHPDGRPFVDHLNEQHERLADWIDGHIEPSAVDQLLGGAVTAGSGSGW